MAKQHKPVIIILDPDPARCVREEEALDRAINDKKIFASGMTHYGEGFISRSGMEGQLPAIEIDGLYYVPPKVGEEITYDMLCRFLDAMVREGVLSTIS